MGPTEWVILFCCISFVCSSTAGGEPFSLKKWKKLLNFLSDSTQDGEILNGSRNRYQDRDFNETDDFVNFNKITEDNFNFTIDFNNYTDGDEMPFTSYPENEWNKTEPVKGNICGSNLCVHGLCERFQNKRTTIWNCRCNYGYTGIKCDNFSTERKMVLVIIVLVVAVVTLQLFSTCYYMAKRRR